MGKRQIEKRFVQGPDGQAMTVAQATVAGREMVKVAQDGRASVTALDPSWWDRARQRVGDFFNGNNKQKQYFDPGLPLPANAPESVRGRKMDYPVGVNTTTQKPKASEGLDYPSLRVLSESLDILRLVIESCKEQVCKLGWHVTKRHAMGAASTEDDLVAQKITNFFMMPDAEHTFPEWLKMLLEDIFVCDTCVIYPVLSDDGTPETLDLVDPATIKLLINDDGRTPPRGAPAYQQVLKGTVANSYTRDEMIVKIRNPRTHKIYGYSAVEQIVVTINTALQRALSQLTYYTKGSTPDLIMSVPEEWSMDQIAEFKNWWDGLLSGNTGQRSGGSLFVPNGMTPYETKDKVMSDKFDEWLARVICFAFRISPMPFIATFNRATAESAQEAAKEDGVGSVMQFVKIVLDQIILQLFKQPQYEFRWKEEDETDPEVKAKSHDIRIKNGSMTIDQSRADFGDPPLPDGMGAVPFIITASGVIRLKDAIEGAPAVISPAASVDAGGTPSSEENPKVAAGSAQKPAAGGAGASAKKGSALVKLAPSESHVVTLRGALNVAFYTLLQSVLSQAGKLLKVKDPTDTITIEFGDGFKDILVNEITSASLDGWGKTFAATEQALPSFKNTGAAAYARERAGALLDEGLLAGATRDFIRNDVVEALENGWTENQLADALADNYAFSDDRAGKIATYELGTATVMGQLDAYEKMGFPGKSWLLSPSENTCPVCSANAAQGVIPIRDEFQSGHLAPLAHPSCACDLIPNSTLEN